MKKTFILGTLLALALFTSGGLFRTAAAVSANDGQLLSTTIVISQVYSGGGGSTGTYLNDYVELKNISASPQSLSGLSLMYASASGNFGSAATLIFALPAVTLQPGQYFLVQTSNPGTAGAALPVPPDASTTNLSMAAASGKVALVNGTFAANSCGATANPCSLPNSGIIDLVSWGAANNAEGGATVNNGTALTSTQGSVRKTNGCTETDNNNADFDVVTAPVPRNTATTPAACGAAAPRQNVVDFNGDGKTDFAVIRNLTGAAGGQMRWFIALNGANTTTAYDWGLSTDRFVPEDYDGDNKSDIAVWRPAAAGSAAFYILQSQNSTLRIELFGQTGDDPTVVGDYDGDGKADAAVYRPGAAAGQQSIWFYRGSANNPSGNVTFVPWGLNGDFPAPGDYDGDAKNDFVVQRNNGGGQARFWLLQSTAGQTSVVFGTPTDVVVPGDWDGDGKTDIATARAVSGAIQWQYLSSQNQTINYITFGASATDFPTQGDYDGDGKTDAAVFRPSVTAGASAFWVNASTGAPFSVPFGAAGDYPAANFNVH